MKIYNFVFLFLLFGGLLAAILGFIVPTSPPTEIQRREEVWRTTAKTFEIGKSLSVVPMRDFKYMHLIEKSTNRFKLTPPEARDIVSFVRLMLGVDSSVRLTDDKGVNLATISETGVLK